jgi:antitoxin YefM
VRAFGRSRDNAEECVIPRGGGRAVVIVSLDEWNAMNETIHVLGPPSNARRLLESIAQADAGLLEEHPLDTTPAPPGTEAA